MSTSETPAQAEAEAEHARADLVSTLSQLRENLKPANVVDEVMSSAKVNASVITDQLIDTAKRNPMPALLIGAGVAMLFGFGTKYSLSARASSARTTAPRYDVETDFASNLSGSQPQPTAPLGSRIGGAIGSVSGRAGDLLDTANDRLVGAVSRGSSRVSSAYSNVKRSGSMSGSRQSIASSLNALIEQQPLVLAAVGVAIGAAIGASLPGTDAENSLMGETSGTVRGSAQTLLQDQLAQAKSAAQHAVEDIKQTVASHGVNADNLSGLVQEVGEKAKSATYEAGRLPHA